MKYEDSEGWRRLTQKVVRFAITINLIAVLFVAIVLMLR